MSYVLTTGRKGSVYESSNLKWGTDALGTQGDRITWSLSLAGLNFGSLFSEAQFVEAANDAFDAWSRYANIVFDYVDGDADIDVVTKTLSGNTVGLATYFFNQGPVSNNNVAIIQSATIDMDLEPNWSPNGEFGILSYFGVLLHEIGHAIGLGHVQDTDQIMNTPISANALGEGDIAGVQVLYGNPFTSEGDDNIDFSGDAVGQTFWLRGGDDVIFASSAIDTIFGGSGNDTINAGDGNDTLIDVLGDNTLNGQNDDDFIVTGGSGTANGGRGRDIILGSSGDDRLSGGADGDTLIGDPANGFFHGNDVLDAGIGDDFLQGGGGADEFVFRPNEGRNTIGELLFDRDDPAATQAVGSDFQSGIDHIRLSGFTDLTAPQAYSYVSDTVEGHAEFAYDGTTIIFFGLTSADLSESDFLL